MPIPQSRFHFSVIPLEVTNAAHVVISDITVRNGAIGIWNEGTLTLASVEAQSNPACRVVQE